MIEINQYTKHKRSEIQRIFFESSSVQEFSSNSLKEQFEYRWLGWYLENERDHVFVLEDDQKILGYLVGTDHSVEIMNLFDSGVMKSFSDLFTLYPAHLHINLDQKARGLGYGSLLINSYFDFLKEINVSGAHILTSVDSKNVSFYLKNNFNFKRQGEGRYLETLFLGRKVVEFL